MFALGLVSWMFGRPTETTPNWLERKFGRQAGDLRRERRGVQGRVQLRRDHGAVRPFVQDRRGAGRPGHLPQRRRVDRPVLGTDRGVASGAVSRCSTRATRSRRRPSCCTSSRGTRTSASSRCRPRTRSRPPTWRSARVRRRSRGDRHERPGMDLKAETIGLAVIMELPMVIVDVQRGGPSTGLPTKTEQADLLLAMFGRHGESPMPIVAPSSPSDCFAVALEAARIAVRYRTPVIVLSDTFLSNSSEPWRVPEVDDLPEIDPSFAAADGEGSCPTPATSSWPGRGPCPAPPGSSPGRRPREGGPHGQHQLRPREPRAHDPPAPGQGRRHRRRHPAARGR